MERWLWNLSVAVLILLFGGLGWRGVTGGHLLEVAVGSLGLLCLAIAADVRALRMSLYEPED